MNDIEIASKIKRENLDERNYFRTLIEEAYFNQMLTDDNMAALRMQILQLLDERVYKYNGNESSSIRREFAEYILDSNNYTISIYLKTFKNPDEAVNLIKEKELKVIYQNGRKKINTMLSIVKVMYIKVKENKLNTQNDTYNDTIIGGIQGFLKIYDPDFKAQDMKITADYPLYNNLIGKLDGIEFIKEYLNSVYLENTFCKKFSEEKIEYLLYGYSYDYSKLIINIFEIVLLETIACKLIKRNIRDLTISISELNTIYKLLENKEKTEVKDIITKAYQDVLLELELDNEEYKEYIERNIDSIIGIIINSIKQKILNKVFITQKFIEHL